MHANRASFLFLLALSLLSWLCLPSVAEAQPLRDEADQILMYFEATEKVKESLQNSLGMVTVRTKIQPGMLDGIHNVLKGVGTLAKCRDRTLVFFPAAIAESAVSASIQFSGKKPLTLDILGSPKEFPIAVGVLPSLPEEITPLPIWRGEKEIDKGLVLTGIAERGPKILSKVYIVETPKPPLERFRITNIRVPDGSPMVTHDLNILAIPVRDWGTQGLSLAVHASTLRKVCDEKLTVEPIQMKSLEINP